MKDIGAFISTSLPQSKKLWLEEVEESSNEKAKHMKTIPPACEMDLNGDFGES